MIKNQLSISNLSEDDRPREKLLNLGASNVTNAELIAILIGSGNREMNAVELGKYILKSCEGNLSQLAKLTVKDLMQFKGIGEAKAISIVSALELGKRRKAEDILKKDKITSSRDVYDIMYPKLLDLNHEEFWVIYLTRANGIIKTEKISSGGMSATVVDVKIIFKNALLNSAAGIILVHNHPSGETKPSEADKKITYNINAAGKLFDISVLDHIIFANQDYFSFKDNALF